MIKKFIKTSFNKQKINITNYSKNIFRDNFKNINYQKISFNKQNKDIINYFKNILKNINF